MNEKIKAICFKIRWSKFADFFRRIKDYFCHRSVKRELNFFKNLIHPDALVFDIGANYGSKTDLFLKLRAKEVIAVEPNPYYLKVLEHRFRNQKNVKLISKAVAATESEKSIFMSEKKPAFNTMSAKWVGALQDNNKSRFDKPILFEKKMQISTITLDGLIKLFGRPDVIKIDVEGYELQVIQGLSSQVDFVWFEANMPEFTKESIMCTRLLNEICSDYLFNCSVYSTDNPNAHLLWNEWVSADFLINLLNQDQYKFMEIFARCKS